MKKISNVSLKSNKISLSQIENSIKKNKLIFAKKNAKIKNNNISLLKMNNTELKNNINKSTEKSNNRTHNFNTTTINSETKNEKNCSFFLNEQTKKNFYERQKSNRNEKNDEIKNMGKNNKIIIYPKINREKSEEKKVYRNKFNHFKKKINIYNLNFHLTINKKKILSVLEDSGVVEAYKYLTDKILKTKEIKNIYRYSSDFLKYQNKKKKKTMKNRNATMDKFFQKKNKNYTMIKFNDNKKIKLLKKIIDNDNKQNFNRSALNIFHKNIPLDNINYRQREKNIFKYRKINIQLRKTNNKNNSKNNSFNSIIKSNNKYSIYNQ